MTRLRHRYFLCYPPRTYKDDTLAPETACSSTSRISYRHEPYIGHHQHEKWWVAQNRRAPPTSRTTLLKLEKQDRSLVNHPTARHQQQLIDTAITSREGGKSVSSYFMRAWWFEFAPGPRPRAQVTAGPRVLLRLRTPHTGSICLRSGQ